MKKIRLNVLEKEKMLRPQEMKNLKGGSDDCADCWGEHLTCDVGKSCNEGRGSCYNYGMGNCKCKDD